MKILLISQYFYPESFRINDFIFNLKETGHDITVLTGIPNYPGGKFYPNYGYFKKNKEFFEDIPVHRVPLLPRGKGTGIRLLLNYLSFAFFATILAPFKCKDEYEVIFVFMPSPITAALPAILMKKIKKIPIFIWVQDLWPETLVAVKAIKSPTLLAIIRKFVKYIYGQCDRILVSSKGFASSIMQIGITEKKIYYFPNTAETFYLEPTLAKNEHEPLPSGFKIIFGGNIGEAQSFSTILSAAASLKAFQEIKWIIIGDGREKEWLQKEVKSHGLEENIYLISQKPPEHMPYYFSQADALLITLKKDPIFSLTIPSKLQSYLACGKPILASLDGEPANIIQTSSAGFVASAEDAISLANNVLKMYYMPISNRIKMGQNGRKYFETHFDRDKLVGQFNSWLEEIVRKD